MERPLFIDLNCAEHNGPTFVRICQIFNFLFIVIACDVVLAVFAWVGVVRGVAGLLCKSLLLHPDWLPLPYPLKYQSLHTFQETSK